MNEARAERPLSPTTIEMEERGLIEPEWRGRQRGQAPFPTTIVIQAHRKSNWCDSSGTAGSGPLPNHY
jgi:hypothetical protein